MLRGWGFWAGFGVLIVAAMMVGTVANAASVTPAATYTVTFTESGLHSGTSWSVTFNSVIKSATTSTITFTGISSGSYYYTTSNDIGGTTDVQYATSVSSGYLDVPYELKQAVVYETQYYVTFTVTPVSSDGTTTPSSNWYNAYSNISIAASAAVGHAFTHWTVSNSSRLILASTSLESTRLQINQPGTVYAAFSTTTYNVNFDESGLPAGTHWTAVLNSVSTSGTTATLTSTGNDAGNLLWSVAPVPGGSGTQYTPTPSTAYINVPYQLSQEIVFVKQYEVTMAVSPGGSGSTNPSTATYYTAGSSFPILGTPAASYVFSHWNTNESKVGVGNTKNAGTNATVKAPATVTADFVAGTLCTTCKLTFSEVGLPAKTGWGVVFDGYYYPTGTASLVLSGLTTGESWSAFSPVGGSQSGVEYLPVGTASNYWYLGSTATIEIVYQQYDYVTFQNNPYSGASATIGSNWYAEGSLNALSAIGTATYTFSSWSASSTNITLGSSTAASTTMKVTGPGVLTENSLSPHVTLHFEEFGLPSGSSWGISLNNVPYFSGTPWINITGSSYGGYSFSPYTNYYGVAGTEWGSQVTYFSLTAPYQTYQAVVFAKEVYVTFTTAGSGTGYVSPSGSTWYWVGVEIPILAENVSGSSFSAWSQTAGTATLGSTSSTATTAIIKAPGTITATFT
jgi:Divergent InlB B-repeat domain